MSKANRSRFSPRGLARAGRFRLSRCSSFECSLNPGVPHSHIQIF
jgi:hypothetical protein